MGPPVTCAGHSWGPRAHWPPAPQRSPGSRQTPACRGGEEGGRGPHWARPSPCACEVPALQPPPHRPVTLRPRLGLRAGMGRTPRVPTWPVRGNHKFQGDWEALGSLSLKNQAQQPAVRGGHPAAGAGGAPRPWGRSLLSVSSRAHSGELPPSPWAPPRGSCTAPRLTQAAAGPGSGPSGPAERWAVGPQGLAEAGRSLPVPHP